MSRIEEEDRKSRVDGHILLEYGSPAKDATVRLYSKSFCSTETILGEGKTDERGHFEVPYETDGMLTNFEVRVVDAHGKEISISHTKFNPDKNEVLNLVAPAEVQPLNAEYDRLVADIEKHIGTIDKLANAQDKDDRQDLSLLYHSSVWDARLIALLAKAVNMSSEVEIGQDALYALYRMGFPTDKQLLASTDLSVLEKAFEKAKKVGIISPNISMKKTKKAFADFSRRVLRDQTAPGTLSSFSEILDKSVLTEDEDKRKFEEIYFSHRGDSPAELWRMAAKRGISSDKIQGLRLQGKLAYLTLNNAILAENLQQEVGTVHKLSKLVDLNLYREDAWKTRLKTIAPDNESLKKIIPPAYEGAANPLDAYADDLARKVRISFPTTVVRRMIEKDELNLREGQENKQLVAACLKKAEGLGFELGRFPLETFIQNNEAELFSGITSDPEKIKSTKESIKKLQRLYQITPSNEAMKVLLDSSFDSAEDVVAFSEYDFVNNFGPSFKSPNEAKLVYRQSEQVANVIHNFFVTAKLIENAPRIYATSPSEAESEEVHNELIKHFPTLENLFGSLDFCECEHCRSVLSPAAYFVDLLRFLEPVDPAWKSTLNEWKNEHRGERYHNEWSYDHRNEEYEDQRKKPYYALIERRPDLPHIPLTCENTNTALPYIDLTNEILEYNIVHNNSLKSYRGHDTSADTTTPELLAEPQNILPEAYDILKRARYPISLPFDLWLETVRMFFEHFDVPFWKVLQLFYQGSGGGGLFEISPRPVIEKPTNNITNATLVIPDSRASAFKAGLAVTYYDVSADTLHSETKTISTIGVPGSGGGPGKTLITLSGFWITPPVTNDFLVIAYGNYSLSSIFNEYLGISPAELEIFINRDPLAKWYELYGYTTDAEALPALESAKALSRRLGVSYKDLVQIVQTGFVNPELHKLGLIWNLHLNVTDVVRYFNNLTKPEYAKEKQDFEKRLSDFDAEYNLAANSSLTALEKHWKEHLKKGTFKKALVLRDTSPLCNFDKTYLKFAVEAESLDPESAEQKANLNLALLKINLLVRLWRKLSGWTIEEIDRVLEVFFSKNISLKPTEANFGQAFGDAFRTSIVYMSHLKSLDEQIGAGKVNRRQKLLALWSDLATTGKKSLYSELFLTRNLLKDDPVFASRFEKYLHYFDSGSSKYIPFRWDGTKPEDPDTGNVSLKNHLATLQAALNMTAEDIEQILFDAKKNLKSEPLTLANVSLIYRYGLLAKALKLSVKDLITLKELSGIDPFKTLRLGPITSLSHDYPFDQTLRFIEVTRKIKESGFTLEDLDFLLSHRFSPVGKYRFNSDVVLGFMNTIADEIRRIQDEEQNNGRITTDEDLRKKLVPRLPPGLIIEDSVRAIRELASNTTMPVTDTKLRNRLNILLGVSVSNELFAVAKVLVSNLQTEYSAVTDDVMKQKLASVLSAEVVDKFFGFWKNSIDFLAKKENVEKKNKLEPTTYEVDGIRVSYDATRRWQQVIHIGVLRNDKKKSVLAKIPKPKATAPQEQKDAYNNFVELINIIAAESQPQPKEFFDKYFEGFLGYDDFFGSASSGLSEQAKRHRIFATILPFVRQKLTRKLVVQSLATNLSADPALVEALLTNKDLLIDPDSGSSISAKKALLDAFTALGYRGVDAKFFDKAGAQLGQPVVVQTVDTSINVDNNPIKPKGAAMARFEGYMVVPKSGAYRFFVILGKKNAEAEFNLHDLPDPLVTRKATRDADETSQFIELKAGILYHFSLNIRDLQGDNVSLLVQSEGVYKEDGLSQLTLYPQTVMDRAIRAYVLLIKVLQMISQLTLSEREVQHILTHRSDFDNIDLSKLPTIKNYGIATNTVILFKQFLLLADYARLKRDLSAGTDDLIGILENASRSYPEEIAPDIEKAKTVHFEPLANLTYRKAATVRVLAESLGFTIKATPRRTGGAGGGGGAGEEEGKYRVEVPELAKVEKLWQLWDALQVVEKLGVPVEKIAGWAKTPAPDFAIAKDQRNTVNARYEPENWQRIAQSIFDKLRQRKRDALVTYIMHNHKEGFERVEQLFEYFLIDPGMEPVVQTSRIRLAIASVQLFIQRSLLNLEKKVHPVAINSKHWLWMKRYRLWEANRRIFLFPENWLEPEFRDDKTHIFQELEGALLQGDVSKDLAEDAFFNYLKKLEQLAKLEIVTIHNEDKPDDPASNILHVIGRTPHLPRQYFYRRYANRMWTPWEPVTAEIEGNHVIAVVWKDRFRLFWLTFLEKPKKQDPPKDKNIATLIAEEPIPPMKKVVEVQLNWSEFFQGQWTDRECNGFGSLIDAEVNNTFNNNEVFVYASFSKDGSLLVNLDSPINKAFRIVSKNSPLRRADEMEIPGNPPYVVKPDQPTKYTGSDALKVNIVEQAKTKGSKTLMTSRATKDIIQDQRFSIIPSIKPMGLIEKIQIQCQALADMIGDILLIVDSSSFRDIIKNLTDFMPALPLRLSDQASNPLAVMKEWRGIFTAVVKAEDSLGTLIYAEYLEILDEQLHNIEILVRELEIKDVSRIEIARFADPFFYENDLHTFFVEPKLTMTTISYYDEFADTVAAAENPLTNDEIEEINVEAFVPEVNLPFPVPDPDPDPTARFKVRPTADWVVRPSTVLSIDDNFIGPAGRLDLKVLSTKTDMTETDSLIKINPGSELAFGSAIVTHDGLKSKSHRSTLLSAGLNIVGSRGVNSMLLRELGRREEISK